MAKLKKCKSCEKEVAKSAKVCPHCGVKLKMGKFLKLIIIIVGVSVLGAIFGPSKEDQAKTKADAKNAIIEQLSNAKPSALQPDGEIGDMFRGTSDYTKIQVEKKAEEIKGSIVEWELPVAEISEASDGRYKIQLRSKGSGKNSVIGGFVYVTPKNDADVKRIEALKEDNYIKIRGILKDIGTFLGASIDPAILVD